MATKPRVLPVKCQRPVDFKEAAIRAILSRVGYVYVEPKYDGFRCHIVVAHDKVYALTREGIELTSITHRVREVFGPYLRANPEQTFDCEVVLPGYKFEEMSGILRRDEQVPDTTVVQFFVFDNVPLKVLLGASGFKAPLYSRKVKLFDALGGLPDTYNTTIIEARHCVATLFKELQELFEAYRALGYEGAVIKDPSQVYQNSKVNGWFKMKPSVTHDGVITGFVDGTNSNKGKLVGFVVRLEDGTECRSTGLTKALINAVTANPEAYLGRLVEVSGMEATAAGNVRHPKHKCFRDSETNPGVKI